MPVVVRGKADGLPPATGTLPANGAHPPGCAAPALREAGRTSREGE